VRRRDFIATVVMVTVLSPLAAFGRRAGATPRLGFLGLTSAAGHRMRIDAFRDGLRDLGYVEGRNIDIEYRWAEGRYDRLPGLAAELVRLEVDVIVTHGTPGGLAAKQATTKTPIVMTAVGEAVESGLVASFARPGGNVTGSAFFFPELMAKRLQVLKEAVPAVSRVAVLLNRKTPTHRPAFEAMKSPARTLGVELEAVDVATADDFDSALAVTNMRRVNALVIPEDGMFNDEASRIVELAGRSRLPAIGGPVMRDAGGLIGYGANTLELWRRSAIFVDRILKGANPADLPVEQPTKFELVINLKTARALGIAIPPTLLARADEVIE
jgi:putative ABC transport system substrate-binding protein